MSKPQIEPTYLGDGVYASFDGFNVWLKTSNGVRITNEIALEDVVLQALDDYRARIDARYAVTRFAPRREQP